MLALLATLFNRKVKFIAALTGLGSLFLAKNIKDKIIKFLLTIFLILGLKKKFLKVIVQNKDDKNFVNKKLFCSINKIAIIRCSGVNIDFHNFQLEPSYPPIIISYVGRLIQDKGIENLIEAFKLAVKSNKDIKLLLVGSLDSKNLRPISKKYIEDSIKNKNTTKIIFYGNYRTYSAILVGKDKMSDIAVLKMDTLEGQTIIRDIRGLQWGNSNNVRQGDDAWAVGHPMQQIWSVSKGIISYIGRRIHNIRQELIQSDFAINI